MTLWDAMALDWISRYGKATQVENQATDFYKSWYEMTTLKPPKGFLGRVLWSLGMLAQVGISLITFPAALAAFLQEEATQAVGMGAYLLAAGKQWDALDRYLGMYKSVIDGATTGAANLSSLQPIVGGAVLKYMSAAGMQWAALRDLTDQKLSELAEQTKEERDKLLEQQNYGSLYLLSNPTNAEIWIDNANTEKLTPETITMLEPGEHTITLRSYSKRRGTWDIYTFTVDIRAGEKKEMKVTIPAGVTGEGETKTKVETKTTKTVPHKIRTVVKGDYAIDGDTFVTQNGEHIRILGINAPEIGQPGAEEAKQQLQELIDNKDITLTIYADKPKDAYGRTLAEVRMYKGNVGRILVANGLARWNPSRDIEIDEKPYQDAEEIAKKRKLGIWKEYPD